ESRSVTPFGAASATDDASSAARSRSSSHCCSKAARFGGRINRLASATMITVKIRRRAESPPGQKKRRSPGAGGSCGGAGSAMSCRYFTARGWAMKREVAPSSRPTARARKTPAQPRQRQHGEAGQRNQDLRPLEHAHVRRDTLVE